MATLVFRMNASLDGYADHPEFAPDGGRPGCSQAWGQPRGLLETD
jgi:hypothetical protein